MLKSILRSVLGTSNRRELKRQSILLDAVKSREIAVAAMTDDGLRAQTGLLKERLAQGENLDGLLPDAFAVAREGSKRVTGMRPFEVQIVGAVTLHQGKIAEMTTGEGKTLVAIMPLYLNALTGKGVHLVTVNDYLARRDSEWMGPILQFLGMTVGVIQQGMPPPERQVAYRADVTYGTNNEFGFDYLRDNMAIRPEYRVQRSLNYAIVDEVDSILVDEARTPLIISGRPEKSTELYVKVDEAVRRLRKEDHYTLEEKGHHVLLTEDGMEMVEQLLGIENLYTNEFLGIVHMIEQSLKAHNFFKIDDEYVVKGNEVLIVDEFTGRTMEGRRYSDGLHQALEAKERIPIQFETQTVASITYQNYFKLYDKLAGMTGTAMTEAAEFDKVYGLDVVQVPTNLPLRREDMTDLIFATEQGKFRHVVREIEEIHKTGRPVLVGTVSIEKSEMVAEMLAEGGIKDFEVLNAKYHEREAAIVAKAGKLGAITIATNMAGRGTDVKLAEGVSDLGGLAIVGTERHESRRIDNQLRGRCGRQGDPGTTQFFVSLEDEVARLFGGDRVKRILDMFGGQSDIMDEEPLSQRMVSRRIEQAQRQVEEYNSEIRKNVLEYDDVMNRQRQVIYEMRRDVLEDRDITEQLHTMFENIVGDAVDEYASEDVLPDEWDFEGLATRLKRIFGFDINPELDGDDVPEEEEVEPVFEHCVRQVLDEYAAREKTMEDTLRKSYRKQIGGDESLIDFAGLARRRVHGFEMMALLKAVDDKWIDHLYSMDYLRDSVRLRAFGQRDPLVEYKSEGFHMFEDMIASIEETVAQMLFRLTDPDRVKGTGGPRGADSAGLDDDPFAQLSHYSYAAADKEQDRSFASYDTSRFALAGQDSAAQSSAQAQREQVRRVPVRKGPRVKPNDPCPCGSGKKYKKCHGATGN